MRYTVTMNRIGRIHNPSPFTVEGRTADDLAAEIHSHCRRFLASSGYEVDVVLIGAAGTVSLGLGRYGEGTLLRDLGE